LPKIKSPFNVKGLFACCGMLCEQAPLLRRFPFAAGQGGDRPPAG